MEGSSNAEVAAEGSHLEGRLAGAQAVLSKLEGIPEASRELVTGFDERLAAAKAERDAVLRERRDAKPWVWRLKGAEKAAARAERAKDKVALEIDSITAQQVALAEQLECKHADLKKAMAAHEEATAKIVSIRAEVSPQKSNTVDGGIGVGELGAGSTVGDAANVLQGLIAQLQELPKAAAAGNLEVALSAALGQVQVLLPGAFPPAVSLEGATAQSTAGLPAAERRQLRANWRNGHSSPAMASCESSADEGSGRSRSHERREREKTTRAVVEGKQRTIRDALVRGAA
jgi:hypothetical protein